ncbi:hypothetical protein [Adhaeretor mobilis]|uniref:Uncharacterized protein n=1 Tax=Adhaeretor mobilis TaxID=1930276 RepID=A0A517MTL8_9BACT|nr:hypothetical protein [Adhaeretor mobilis]QDS98228.1 hypothetical protein HG15A2_15010 [Adhaeretor mobilis]
MNSPIASYVLMTVGAVLALVLAAGPLATSLVFQLLFGAALLLLTFGVVMRRLSARKDALAGSADGEIRQALEALKSLHLALQQTVSECISIEDMTRFHGLVQAATQPPARDFLRFRQSLLDAYGFKFFAELMIHFASVERAMNRTLSASADGAGEEARACLLQASQRMEHCLAALHRFKGLT